MSRRSYIRSIEDSYVGCERVPEPFDVSKVSNFEFEKSLNINNFDSNTFAICSIDKYFNYLNENSLKLDTTIYPNEFGGMVNLYRSNYSNLEDRFKK